MSPTEVQQVLEAIVLCADIPDDKKTDMDYLQAALTSILFYAQGLQNKLPKS
jgi:hypothetical protein